MKAIIYLGKGQFRTTVATPVADPHNKGGVYQLPEGEKAYDSAVWKWSHDEIRDGVLHVCRG